MSDLRNLFNIGKVLEQHLLAVGIQNAQQLRETGAQKVFILIRQQRDAGACLHMLYGLEGAVREIPDSQLPEQVKTELKHFFKTL